MAYDKHFDVGAVKKCWKKNLGVTALLPMLCRLRFSRSFQSDNHVYRGLSLNNSTFFI